MSGDGVTLTPIVVRPPRTRRGWDVALSVVLLLLNGGLFLLGALFQLFGLAFTDHCPPETCNISAGVDAVFTVASLLALVGILATVVTVVLLVQRFRAWWVPVLAIIVTIVGWAVSFSLYARAVT